MHAVVVVVVDIFDAEAKAVVGDAAGIKRVELLVSKENSTAFNINRKLLRYSAAAAGNINADISHDAFMHHYVALASCMHAHSSFVREINLSITNGLKTKRRRK